MHSARGSSWKLWVLIIALVLVIAVLGFLCVRFLLGSGGLFRSHPAPAASADLTTQAAAQDANGRDVSDKIAVTESTLRPDSVAADAELTLLDIEWTAKRDASYPLIVTVSDPSFPDNDGLSVYHCADGVWELLGTYLIENHSVSFQTDSLSPFAFQVISSQPSPTPEPTPTPAPTPEPTDTPEPTPTPIDYGLYSQIQPGEFVEVTDMEKDGVYVIALIDELEPVAEEETAEDGETEEETEAEAITFFDAVERGQTVKAEILINYDGSVLSTVEANVRKGADGRYAIDDPVVEGMLWTVETEEFYSMALRFSLTNNKRYLNIDSDKASIVLDENDGRTRWTYDSVSPEDGVSFDTLSYRVDFTNYYIQGFEVVNNVSDEGTDLGSAFSVPVTTETGEAKRLVIFQSRTAAPVSTDNSANENGVLIMTNTPEPVTGLDSTPAPTPTEAPSYYIQPQTTVPTAPPSSQPTTNPTEIPLENPSQSDNSGNSGGTSAASGTNYEPVPDSATDS